MIEGDVIVVMIGEISKDSYIQKINKHAENNMHYCNKLDELEKNIMS